MNLEEERDQLRRQVFVLTETLAKVLDKVGPVELEREPIDPNRYINYEIDDNDIMTVSLH